MSDREADKSCSQRKALLSNDRPEDDAEQDLSSSRSSSKEVLDRASFVTSEEEAVFTVDEVINKMGFGPFQVLITVFCGLIWVADAMELMILSILSPIVKCQWDLSSTEEAAVTSVVFLGLIVGVFFWGLMNDLIGRKTSLLLVDICVVVCGVLSAIPVSADDGRLPGYPWLLICRFGVGFSCGGAVQVTTYYAEFLPQKRRGIWLVLIAMWWTIGSIFCAALAIVVLGVLHLNWHWFLGLAVTPMAMVLFLFPFVPESARFYLIKGKYEKARKVIERVAKINCKEIPSGRLVLQVDKEVTIEDVVNNTETDDVSLNQFDSIGDGKPGTPTKEVPDKNNCQDKTLPPVEEEDALSHADISQLVEEDHWDEHQAKQKARISKWLRGVKQFSPLFVKGMWKTTFILFFIWFGAAWSYYGVVILTTTMLSSDPHCGISHYVQNSTGCIELDKGDYVKILWASAAEFPGLVLTFIIIEILGRKKTMAIEFAMAAGGFLLLLICASKIVLTVFLFIVRAFVAGVFQVAFVYTPEVYPTEARALGLGVCNVAARVGGLLTPFAAQVVFAANDYVSISLYAGTCVFFTIMSMLLPIETKGRPLLDK